MAGEPVCSAPGRETLKPLDGHLPGPLEVVGANGQRWPHQEEGEEVQSTDVAADEVRVSAEEEERELMLSIKEEGEVETKSQLGPRDVRGGKEDERCSMLASTTSAGVRRWR